MIDRAIEDLLVEKMKTGEDISGVIVMARLVYDVADFAAVLQRAEARLTEEGFDASNAWPLPFLGG